MKILFLTPYPPDEAPSQRFRFEQYLNLMASNFQVEAKSFLTKENWRAFYKSGNAWRKGEALLNGLFNRLTMLISLDQYQYVFIHREVAPIGPPIFEWIIAKVFRKKIIYDFDDAIWLTDKTDESRIEKILRWRSKVSTICKWSYKVSCGNAYLATYARQFNTKVVVNPTTVDTEHLHNPSKRNPGTFYKTDSQAVVIGWTGSHSTIKYLKCIEHTLQRIEEKFEHVSFLVIADRKPELALKRLRFVVWNKLSEATDLQLMDIGVMPLPDDEWAKGKCGFKALQYMAMEIPALVSPVGVNAEIVTNGKNGFWCSSDVEWLERLTQLVNDASSRKQLGKHGRELVEERYSVKANEQNFRNLFS
jgi:glycosyltransferase involved in cell wall biosynthesis